MVKYNENAIREAAYYIWQNAGCPQGQDEQFWSMAVEQFDACKNSCGVANKATSGKACVSKPSCEKKKVAPKKAAAVKTVK